MKRNMAILLLVFLAIVGSFCFLTPDIAALNSTSHLKLYHSEAKTFIVGKDVFTFRNFTQAENQATSAGFSVVEITVPPKDKSFLLEKHANPTEETFYALAGQFEFSEQSSGKRIQVNAGEAIQIPTNLPYGLRNIGAESEKLLLVVNSLAFSKFIAEIGTPIVNSSSSTVASTPLSMDEIAAIARKYDLKFFN